MTTTDENQMIAFAMSAIGMDTKKPYKRHGKRFFRPDRNLHVVTINHPVWATLRQKGYAVRAKRDTYEINSLTRAGLDWLGRELGVKIYDYL